jgi:site-specific DNA recombinase
MSDTIPVVIYGSLSKKDEDDGDDSIQSQIDAVREKLDQIGGRAEVSGPYTDHGYSGSKRNRGPALEQAITAAVTAAAEHGEAELWAVVSSRFGRGSGRLNEARAIGGLFYELRAKGVALRTVTDDEFVTNEMLIGFASRQASKYTDELAASVKRAKRRQAEAGKHLGGPPPLGVDIVDGELVPDPTHLGSVLRIFELAAQGVPDARLSRMVNEEGHRTKAGKPFERRNIQAIVTNPTYAGLIVYEGTEYEATWKPLVDRKAWRVIQAARGKRDLGAERHVKGRPARRHLLAKLARCGACGSPMYVHTSPYRRKDGSRKRLYLCRGYHDSDGTCDVKVDAKVVDDAVLEHLPRVMPRFQEWVSAIEDRHAAERARLSTEVERAREDRNHQAHKLTAAEAKWSEYLIDDDAKAETVLPMVDRQRQAAEQADARLRAAEDALATVPEQVERDRLLDLALNLRAEIDDRIEGSRSVEELNRKLTELFRSFTIWTELPDDITREEVDASVEAGTIYVFPNLRREVFWRLIFEDDDDETPTPPMEWIEGISGNTQL